MTSRMSSGSSFADKAVEPTRSMNITVSWRRSASRRRGTVSWGEAPASAGSARSSATRAAIARSNFLRGPSGSPSFSRSASPRSARTSPVTSASRNTGSYRSSPSCFSHSAMSTRGRSRSSLGNNTLTQSPWSALRDGGTIINQRPHTAICTSSSNTRQSVWSRGHATLFNCQLQRQCTAVGLAGPVWPGLPRRCRCIGLQRSQHRWHFDDSVWSQWCTFRLDHLGCFASVVTLPSDKEDRIAFLDHALDQDRPIHAVVPPRALVRCRSTRPSSRPCRGRA